MECHSANHTLTAPRASYCAECFRAQERRANSLPHALAIIEREDHGFILGHDLSKHLDAAYMADEDVEGTRTALLQEIGRAIRNLRQAARDLKTYRPSLEY